MRLVIDTNIVISAPIASTGQTSELLFNIQLLLFSPSNLALEMNEHKTEILEKTGLSELDYDIALSRIYSRISIIPADDLDASLSAARSFCPDLDDLPYLALALHLGCPLWTNDKLLKKQKEVVVLSTTELLEKLQGQI